MELRYKCNTTNKCDKCGNLDAKLYEAIVITEEWNEDEEQYEDVEVVEYEVCVCTKCSYEERV